MSTSSSSSGPLAGGSSPPSAPTEDRTFDLGADVAADAKKRVGMTLKGKWTLDGLLGVGGMAAVYRATHRNGNQAAIKLLHPEFARDANLRQRFVREGYVANRVDHPGRVAIIDDDVSETGAPFLVMELLEGQSLQQRLKKKSLLGLPEALRIAADVLDTLVPFHAQQIVHRDLKPGNIFLSEDGPTKLLDFGVAQMRERGAEATRAGTAFGTPSFMAPEQAMGKVDTLDGRADVFAMGATLYACLSGQRLWHGKSSHESYILAATQPAPSLARVAPELPVEAIALVDRALQWDRRNRFQSAAEMRDAILGLLGRIERGEIAEDPMSAPPVPSSRRPPATPSRHPASRRGMTSLPPPPAAASRPEGPRARSRAPGPRVSLRPTSLTRPPPGSRFSHPPPATGGELPLSAPPPPLGVGAVASVLEWDGIKRDDVYRRLDRLLKALRHYGPTHPEATSKVHGVHEAIISVLRTDPEGLAWEVQPYCLSQQGESVWEPEPPADVIPYNLYASGLKRVQFLPGLPEEELRTFCELIASDVTREEEGVDIAGALWDSGFTKIALEITDDLTGFDATEEESFWAEADEVEMLVREGIGTGIDRTDEAGETAYADALAMVLDPQSMLARGEVAEAVAMAMAVGESRERYAERADALQLDAATAAILLGELSLPAERWHERFLDIATDALADAAWREDEPLVWRAFGTHARRLLRGTDPTVILSLSEGLVTRLAPFLMDPAVTASLVGLTGAIYQGPTLEWLVKLAGGQSSEPKASRLAPDDPLRKRALDTLGTVVGLLDATGCADGLTLAEQTPDGEALELLLRWLGRHVAGNEPFFADQIHRLGPRLAHRVMGLLQSAETEEALGTIRALRESANPSLRCEALALTAESHERLKDQLLEMLDALDVSLRAAALSTMVRHQVRAAGPGLVRRIESESFRVRPIDVQRELLIALNALHARRAETMLCSILRQHGLMKDEALDRTRALAAELLGEWGDSDGAMSTLEEAQARRWWNSAELREAARAAADRVAERRRAASLADPGGPR